MTSNYGQVPKDASLQPKPFEIKISEKDLSEFKQLLKLSKLAPKTYENQLEDRRYGVSLKWMTETKQYWENKFDWRASEARMNSFPNFIVPVEDDMGEALDVHFAALFSQKPDAIPILLLHGWPGCWLEFLPIMEILKNKYKPEDLPYHVIAPSSPGCAFSSGPPLDRDFQKPDASLIFNKLMIGLGFESGYLAQGGDVGSFESRILAVHYDACKAVHLNFSIMKPPENVDSLSVNEAEQKGLARAREFLDTGDAYGKMHGTRPSTIGLTLASSPIALLAWIGEKLLAWSDEDPSIDHILDIVTLYWFTESFPRHIYQYRAMYTYKEPSVHGDPKYYIKKPFGYSWFPQELAPMPKSWVETNGDLVWSRQHTSGGHFAALEKPKELLQDIEDFLAQVWPSKGKL